MKKEIIEQLVDMLNDVINSKLSTIDSKDLEKLIVIREKIKICKNQKALAKILLSLSKFFSDDDD